MQTCINTHNTHNTHAHAHVYTHAHAHTHTHTYTHTKHPFTFSLSHTQMDTVNQSFYSTLIKCLMIINNQYKYFNNKNIPTMEQGIYRMKVNIFSSLTGIVVQLHE